MSHINNEHLVNWAAMSEEDKLDYIGDPYTPKDQTFCALCEDPLTFEGITWADEHGFCVECSRDGSMFQASGAVVFSGEYAVYILDKLGEIVSWNMYESEEDSTIFAIAATAVAMALTQGPAALREFIKHPIQYPASQQEVSQKTN